MNHITVTVKAIENARRIEGRIPAVFCNVEIAPPPFGKSYTPTYAELRVWGKASNYLEPAQAGSKILVNDAEFVINYNKETRSNQIEIKARETLLVPEQFPNINTVILTGRTAIEFDPNDSKQRNYRATSSGWVFGEQRIAVQNKDASKYPDVYNFKTVYNTNAEYRGINYADMIANHLHKKNIPLTIKGSLVTEKSEIEGQDPRYYPKILLADKNAIAVHSLQPIGSQTVKRQEPKPQAPPTVITEDAWNDLPSLAPDPTPTPPVNPTPMVTANTAPANTDNEPF